MQIAICRLFTLDTKTFATLSAVEWSLLSANGFLSLQIDEKDHLCSWKRSSNSSVGASLNNFTRKKSSLFPDYLHLSCPLCHRIWFCIDRQRGKPAEFNSCTNTWKTWQKTNIGLQFWCLSTNVPTAEDRSCLPGGAGIPKRLTWGKMHKIPATLQKSGYEMCLQRRKSSQSVVFPVGFIENKQFANFACWCFFFLAECKRNSECCAFSSTDRLVMWTSVAAVHRSRGKSAKWWRIPQWSWKMIIKTCRSAWSISTCVRSTIKCALTVMIWRFESHSSLSSTCHDLNLLFVFWPGCPTVSQSVGQICSGWISQCGSPDTLFSQRGVHISLEDPWCLGKRNTSHPLSWRWAVKLHWQSAATTCSCWTAGRSWCSGLLRWMCFCWSQGLSRKFQTFMACPT